MTEVAEMFPGEKRTSLGLVPPTATVAGTKVGVTEARASSLVDEDSLGSLHASCSLNLGNARSVSYYVNENAYKRIIDRRTLA